MSNIHVGMHSESPVGDAAYDIPCGWACTLPTDFSHPELPVRVCEQGLTLLQLHVLIAILGIGSRIVSYKWLSMCLSHKLKRKFSAESSRGVVDRLITRGYLCRHLAQEGVLRGLRYQVVAKKVCPFLARAIGKSTAWDTHEAVQEATHPKEIERSLSVSPSIVESTARQKLKTLADSDIELRWPELHKDGFRMTQIHQILASLDKAGVGCDDVMLGLDHAEWLLAATGIFDKHGNAVEKPLSWVFKTLARQGYYPRPVGYISPQEQAARDAAEEKKRLADAMEELHEAEFCAWSNQLLIEERTEIIKAAAGDNPFPMPDRVRLKAHFDAHIWPEMQKRHKKEE